MHKYEKYKDSDIEWLGEIPKHWKVRKLKYCINGRLKYGANEPGGDLQKDDPRYIRITDFDKSGKPSLLHRGKIEIYDTNMNRTSEITLDNTHHHKKIRISDDDVHFFIGHPDDRSINKYSISGEFITKWYGRDNFFGTLIATYGTGDRERVYLGTGFEEGQKLEVYSGEGKFYS